MSEVQGAVLEHTGERMVPELCAADTFWEHVYRYRFAARFARDRRVLDIACGEGYGTAALAAAGARSVLGVDISPEACEHARRKYRVETRVGSAESIPLDDGAMDVVVSFETVEHVESAGRFLAECRRVLAPGGTLIMSTPNRPVYSPHGKHNRFHTAEMDEGEFRAALGARFKSCELYAQRLASAAWWSSRALGADGSAWSRFLVGRAVLHGIRRLFCPRVMSRPAEAYRRAPVRAVLAPETRAAELLNPFVVRKQSPGRRERPAYWVAVAS
jgi:SAM-dependent methyltransferase